MTNGAKVHEIAERVAGNSILTAIARVSIALSVSIGIPAGVYIVSSTTSHGREIALLTRADDDFKRRIELLEAAAARMPQDERRLIERIAALEALAQRFEERTQTLLRAIDQVNRERSLYPGVRQ